MGSFTENNNNNNNNDIIHAKGASSVIVELQKGEQMAIQLQNLLDHKDDDDDDVAPVSAQDLALRILTSFTDTLSALTTKKARIKHPRGCYKRRRSSDSWTTITPAIGDGYAWRKYGQKLILNSQYPRCYYRCTNKYEQGCEATKQVQRIKENPVSYQTTYFVHHTCTDHHHHTPSFTRAPPPIMGSDPVEPNSSLPFQASSHSKQDDDVDDDHCYTTNPMMMIKKEESKQESPISEDILSVDPDPARLSLDDDQWLDFIGSESCGYKPNGAPLMGSFQDEACHSRGPTSLHGLDMDVVNQFGDIDNVHFDDEIF